MGRTLKRTLTYAGIALWALGCSSSSPTSSSGGQVTALDGGELCNQPGAGACDSTLGAMCARFTQCCAGVTSCQPWATDLARCKAHWVETGINCASAEFANKVVCPSSTTYCQEDIPLVACTDVTNGTANWPASCGAFWSQFR
jgi:hypothetical protein